MQKRVLPASLARRAAYTAAAAAARHSTAHPVRVMCCIVQLEHTDSAGPGTTQLHNLSDPATPTVSVQRPSLAAHTATCPSTPHPLDHRWSCACMLLAEKTQARWCQPALRHPAPRAPISPLPSQPPTHTPRLCLPYTRMYSKLPMYTTCSHRTKGFAPSPPLPSTLSPHRQAPGPSVFLP